MPTRLGQPYRAEWRGAPPAMLQTDVPVWHRFLDLYRPLFIRVFYDCELGGPLYSEETLQDPLFRSWARSVSKRLDALAELEDEIWLIECAQRAGVRAIGQLQTYRALWMQDPKINKPERLVLVCELLDEDLAQAAATIGMHIYLTPGPMTPTTQTPTVTGGFAPHGHPAR